MAKSYSEMHKINELAVELEKELLKFQDWMQADIEYSDHLYMQDVIVAGYIHEYGEEDASAQVEQSDLDEACRAHDEYVDQYHPELKVIRSILPYLQQLKPTGS